MLRFQTFIPLFALLCSCSSTPRSTALRHSGLELTATVGDARIGSYVSSWKGFRTSSYWIEGPTGLIVIDTQFLPSASLQMLETAEKLTGKKVELAIVLHPNPDKFNGTAVYQNRGIKVVTSAQVAALIPSVHQLRTEWFFDRFKPDYPVETPTPTSFGDHTTELTAGGITVKAHVMGAGCSGAHVVVEYDRNVFVGDLITIGFHSWLELGRLDEWLQRLDEIKAMKPLYVRTGRGGSGDSESIDREAEYLKTVMKMVRLRKQRNPRAEWNDDLATSLADEIVGRYPAYEYRAFVENGLEEVWKHTVLRKR